MIVSWNKWFIQTIPTINDLYKQMLLFLFICNKNYNFKTESSLFYY